MSITPLGAGQEVGRSCHVLEFRGHTIMLDIGIHPGYDGLNGLPFLDRVEPESIDFEPRICQIMRNTLSAHFQTFYRLS